MGQQQLLLLVLSIVLVGLAVTTGITAFEEAAQRDRKDRQLAFMVELAARVEVWRRQPMVLGGGLGGELTEMGFRILGYPHEPTDDKLLYRENVGCAYTFPVFNDGPVPYSTVRIYELDACPTDRGGLDDDDLVGLVRLYPDHWRYRQLPGWEWTRIDW